MNHIDPIHLHIILNTVHEDQISLIQCRVVVSTWNYEFCDNYSKKPLIHLESTNMKVFDLSSMVPQPLAIILNFFEFLDNPNFPFLHLNTPSFESNHIFPSFLVDLHADNNTSFLNSKLVKNTFTKSGYIFLESSRNDFNL